MNSIKRVIRLVIPKDATRLLEKIYRQSRGLMWQIVYGFPARKMRVIAITGTNGKSTTASYINEILKAAGHKTAVLTTVFYEVDDVHEPNRTHFTIDKQSIVQSFFARARRAKVDWVILEVTSHALDQGRIAGVPVEIAVITNLTQDHLDYHGTMEEYAAVKSRLLTDYGAKYAVLNTDDDWYEFFASKSSAEVFSFGKSPVANAKITGVKLNQNGGQAVLAAEGKKLKLKTNLLGEFNIYNAAAAASVGILISLPEKAITDGVSALNNLDGRMERVEAGQDFVVLVDFAITPDALEKALSSLQKITKGSVRVVFGATGDRDKGKRPKMGVVATRYADYIYLTDDETYTEDPKAIRDAVMKGIKKAGGTGKTKVIADRKKAIQTALSEAASDDAVLLTGIGHEDSRNMGGRQLPWSEHEVARKALAKLKQRRNS